MELVKINDEEEINASIFLDHDAFEASPELAFGHGTFSPIAISFER